VCHCTATSLPCFPESFAAEESESGIQQQNSRNTSPHGLLHQYLALKALQQGEKGTLT